MFLRMLGRSFLEGRKRKVLAATTVALAAALVTTLLNLSVDVGDKMAREMKSYGSNINVTPKSQSIPLEIGGIDFNPLKDRDYLDETELPKIKDIFWRNNIVGLAPFLKTTVEIEGGRARPVSLVGTYFDKTMPIPDDETYRTGVTATHPFWTVDGDWPDEELSTDVLVGRALAERIGVTPGSILRVRQHDGAAGWTEYAVAGLLTTGGPEDHAIVAPLAAVQALTGLAGKVQSVSVSALTVPENELSHKARRDTDSLSTAEYDVWYCTAYVSSIAHQIEESVINASARPVWQVAAGEGAVISKIQVLMLVVSLAAFVSAAMGVSSLMNTTVMERAREIGLMKALGAKEWEIHALFLCEAAIVGAVGGVVGFAIGTGLSQAVGWAVFGSDLSFHWIAVPVVVAVAVATALAGSIVPSRGIARLMPVEVLHGRR